MLNRNKYETIRIILEMALERNSKSTIIRKAGLNGKHSRHYFSILQKCDAIKIAKGPDNRGRRSLIVTLNRRGHDLLFTLKQMNYLLSPIPKT